MYYFNYTLLVFNKIHILCEMLHVTFKAAKKKNWVYSNVHDIIVMYIVPVHVHVEVRMYSTCTCTCR